MSRKSELAKGFIPNVDRRLGNLVGCHDRLYCYDVSDFPAAKSPESAGGHCPISMADELDGGRSKIVR